MRLYMESCETEASSLDPFSSDEKPPSHQILLPVLFTPHPQEARNSHTNGTLTAPQLRNGHRPGLRKALCTTGSSTRGSSTRFRENPKTAAYRRKFFPSVSNADWNDWRWQSRNRIRTLAQLEKQLSLSADERAALIDGGSMLPVG